MRRRVSRTTNADSDATKLVLHVSKQQQQQQQLIITFHSNAHQTKSRIWAR
jgi:hypothetical protein